MEAFKPQSPGVSDQTLRDPQLRAELFKSAHALVTDAFSWRDEWADVRHKALTAMREAQAPYTAREAPELGKAVHGDLYCQEGNGYSYWIIYDSYGDPCAYELLPPELDPREKPMREIQEKATYLGRAEHWYALRWHHELLG